MDKLVREIKNYYKDRNILLTGHTGFKGTWFSIMLDMFGANTFGISLPPSNQNRLFSEIKPLLGLKSYSVDLNDLQLLSKITDAIEVDTVFHFAAQSLVPKARRDPFETYQTNIVGTLNLLKSLESKEKNIDVVIITTDKVYKETDDLTLFCEDDTLGGNEPYSLSKVTVDLLIQDFAKHKQFANMRFGLARAGNVIGGGDWAEDRLIPDFVRSALSGEVMFVRNANATRPWQHVVEPLFGYAVLAMNLEDNFLDNLYNFGPDPTSILPVKKILDAGKNHFPDVNISEMLENLTYETTQLGLSNEKAKRNLGIHPKWDIETTLGRTFSWYHSYIKGANPYDLCIKDLNVYFNGEI